MKARRFIYTLSFTVLFFFIMSAGNLSADVRASFDNLSSSLTYDWIGTLDKISISDFLYITKRTEWQGLQNPGLHHELFLKVDPDAEFTTWQAIWGIIFCKHDETCYEILARMSGKFTYGIYDFYHLTSHRPGLRNLRRLFAEKIHFISYNEYSLYAFLKEDEMELAYELVAMHCGMQYRFISTDFFRNYAFSTIGYNSRSGEYERYESGLQKNCKDKIARKYGNIRMWYISQIKDSESDESMSIVEKMDVITRLTTQRGRANPAYWGLDFEVSRGGTTTNTYLYRSMTRLPSGDVLKQWSVTYDSKDHSILKNAGLSEKGVNAVIDACFILRETWRDHGRRVDLLNNYGKIALECATFLRQVSDESGYIFALGKGHMDAFCELDGNVFRIQYGEKGTSWFGRFEHNAETGELIRETSTEPEVLKGVLYQTSFITLEKLAKAAGK